jgi:spore maturation protein CgeB
MRILIAGDWQYGIYEQAFADALARQGHEVVAYRWGDVFAGTSGLVQLTFPLPGPALLRLNRALLTAATGSRPDVVLVWRGTHVLPATLERVRAETGAAIVTYNNDDPYGGSQGGAVRWRQVFKWHWYNKSHAVADLSLVYRPVNLGEVRAGGARRAAVMPPYFIPDKDRSVVLRDADVERFGCDVVFVGHYEPDGRERYLKALVDAGLHVRLFGGRYWTPAVLGETAAYFGTVHEAHGDDYAKALCGARMCLCFLSRLNRDTYTRRCFEIPASGSLLLSERTADLQWFFREDEEAVFFSSVDELVMKARWLKAHPDDARRIAAAGMRRVHADGHSVNDRARGFIARVREIRCTARP